MNMMNSQAQDLYQVVSCSLPQKSIIMILKLFFFRKASDCCHAFTNKITIDTKNTKIKDGSKVNSKWPCGPVLGILKLTL